MTLFVFSLYFIKCSSYTIRSVSYYIKDLKVNKVNLLEKFDCTAIKFRIMLEVVFAPPFQIKICHTWHIPCLALATKFAEEGNV